MTRRLAKVTSVLGAAALALSAVPAHAAQASDQEGTTQTQPKHHSKLKGAAVGGVGGALVGGKKGAVAGSAGGALVQHHRNKKAAKRAQHQQ